MDLNSPVLFPLVVMALELEFVVLVTVEMGTHFCFKNKQSSYLALQQNRHKKNNTKGKMGVFSISPFPQRKKNNDTVFIFLKNEIVFVWIPFWGHSYFWKRIRTEFNFSTSIIFSIFTNSPKKQSSQTQPPLPTSSPLPTLTPPSSKHHHLMPCIRG